MMIVAAYIKQLNNFIFKYLRKIEKVKGRYETFIATNLVGNHNKIAINLGLIRPSQIESY